MKKRLNRGIAIAGSYNYSNNAEQNNDENLLIFHSSLIANQYYQDYMGAMNRSTGKSSPPVPKIYTDEWYPVMDVIDGNLFEIEIAEGLGYPVRFLGVDAPRIYVRQDSSEYFQVRPLFSCPIFWRIKKFVYWGMILECPNLVMGHFGRTPGLGMKMKTS